MYNHIRNTVFEAHKSLIQFLRRNYENLPSFALQNQEHHINKVNIYTLQTVQ